MLFFVWILARKNRLFIKKAIYILGIFLLTFGICVFSSIGNNKGNLANNNKKVAVNNNHNIEESAMQKYFERNIAGTFDEKAGSNSSRYSLIKSDIFIGKEHWLLGVGLNLKNAYNTEYFLKNGIINSEIGSCQPCISLGFESKCRNPVCMQNITVDMVWEQVKKATKLH